MTVAPPSPREEHLAAARLHVSRSEFDQALPAFAAAEELGAFDEALQVERIKSYVKAERFDEALTLLQARAAWTEAAAYRMIGLIMDKREQWTEAAAGYRQAIAIEEDDVGSRYELARDLYLENDYAGAAAEAALILEIDPHHGRACRLWADALQLNCEFRAAIAKFEETQQCDPGFPANAPDLGSAFYNGWGNALFGVGRRAEALEMYERAMAEEPDNVIPQYNAAVALQSLEDWAGAVAAFEKIPMEERDVDTFTYLATALWKLGDDERAAEMFARAREADPEAIEPHVWRATMLWHRGDYLGARAEAAALFEVYTSQREAYIAGRCGASLIEAAYVFVTILNDSVTAMAAYAAAEQSLRGEHERPYLLASRMEYFLTLQEWYPESRSQYEGRARSEFRRLERLVEQTLALDLPEKQTEIDLLRLGRALLVSGNPEAAEPWLDRAAARATVTTDTWLALGAVKLRLGAFARAIRCFENAARADSDDIPARIFLGRALLAGGELDRAAFEFRRVLSRSEHCVHARVGLAMTNLELAEKDNADLYPTVVDELSKALDSAALLRGLKTLTDSELSDIYYLRGFARTKMFNNQQTQRDRTLLLAAREDFRSSSSHNRAAAYRADAAVKEIDSLLRTREPQWVGENVAGMICGVAAIATFITGTVRMGLNLSPGYAALLIFGGLIFLIASFYLPQVMKLKFAGVELEKANVDRIAARPLQIKKLALPAPALGARM